MNISIGENSRNKKNPFEYIVPSPPPYHGVGTIKHSEFFWLLFNGALVQKLAKVEDGPCDNESPYKKVVPLEPEFKDGSRFCFKLLQRYDKTII